MINAIISFSIKHKFIVGLFTMALIGVGIYSMYSINLGSVPDITNNQVQVMTVAENLATEDVEQFITYPVELAMGNLPGVKEIRSVSRFGLSVVTIVFEDRMGIYKPRQLVQEKLNEIKNEIPQQFGEPTMGPITTGLGEIYQYTIEPQQGFESAYSTTELRTIQDWIVKRQLNLVKGVIDVNAFGGSIKQYEVALNPQTLKSMDVSIGEVYQALRANNANTGGAYIERKQMANFIRGEGLIQSLKDVESIIVKNVNGIPITIEDVAADVRFGEQVRYGAFTKDGKEAVGGMVLMLKGANPNEVVQNVKNRIATIQKSLPEGLQIIPFLDRSKLIERTTDTVTTNLVEGALIVIFALVLLLGSLRGGIITATTIPLSLLFAFILMKVFNVWANLMSLGAIDFGIIIDGAVIIIEGTVYEIQKKLRSGNIQFNQRLMDKLAYDAGSTMMNSAFFGQVIILIVFTPILFLEGVEGKMFQPMAYTFGFGMIGAIILCLTYVPMMSALLMKPITKKNHWFAKFEGKLEYLSNRIIVYVQQAYQPLLKKAMRYNRLVLIIAVALLILSGIMFTRMGGEFIPQLDEGDIAMQALVRPGSSLTESIESSERIEKTLLENFPEIKAVTSRIGVADIPTDPMPMDIADMTIVLEKNQAHWVTAETKESLIDSIKDHLNKTIIGVNLVFTQPVELRFNELLTGVREDVAIKLYGDDLDLLASKADEIATIIGTIPGVGDVNPERTAGLPQMTVQYNRKKLAQYGITIEKLNQYVSTAFAGGKAGVIFEGEKRFDLVVRLDKPFRKEIEDLKFLFVDLPNGEQIPLKELADISFMPGPMQISRDNTFRRVSIGVNTRGRDVETVVEDIQKRLDESLELPPGYYIAYGGEFENLQSAKKRLAIVVPIALFLIFILLYFALQSFAQSIMIYMAIPLAAIGGILALWLRDMPFSISAGVGFIVLFGVAVLNGLVLINRFNSLKTEGIDSLQKRIFTGTKERVRPILLTATTDIFGFLPMAFSSSAGAEVQRPLATVVIGGMLTATVLTLIVLPILYHLVETQRQRNQAKRYKMAKVVSVFFVIGTFSLMQNVYAQQPKQKAISLEEAQNMALDGYPELKASKLQIEEQNALVKTAWDLGNTQIYTGREEFDSQTEGVQTLIGIQQQQIDVFGIVAKKRLHEKQVALSETQYALRRLEVKKQVGQSWVRAYTKLKTYSLYQQLDSLFNQISEALKVQKETEQISPLQYLAMQNRTNEMVLKKEQAYHDYMISLESLNNWFGANTDYTIAQVAPDSIMLSHLILPDSVYQHSLLQQATDQVKIADASVKLAKSAFLPSFQGLYGIQQIDGQSGFQTFQVGIRLPLFFGPEMGKAQAAKIRAQISQEHAAQQRISLMTDYQTVKSNYLKWQASWQYYQKEALPLAKKQQEAAVLSFQEGAIDYANFTQILQEAIQTELNAWRALEKYLDSQFELTYYLEETYQ